MSKELKNKTEEIMNKINNGQIKMRPKIYFVFGYILSILGLVFSFTTSIFFIGLIRFSLRSHGPMGQYRLEQILSTFSWWMPLLAFIGLAVGIWLLRKYDFSYKINFKLLSIGLVVSIIIAGFVIDIIGLNDFWINKRQGRNKIYNQEKFKNLNNYNIINK